VRVAIAAAPVADEEGGAPEPEAAVGVFVTLARLLEEDAEPELLALGLALVVALLDAKKEVRALDSDAHENLSSPDVFADAEEDASVPVTDALAELSTVLEALDSAALEGEASGFFTGAMTTLAIEHWSPMCWS
jgi:hypothetical protein